MPHSMKYPTTRLAPAARPTAELDGPAAASGIATATAVSITEAATKRPDVFMSPLLRRRSQVVRTTCRRSHPLTLVAVCQFEAGIPCGNGLVGTFRGSASAEDWSYPHTGQPLHVREMGQHWYCPDQRLSERPGRRVDPPARPLRSSVTDRDRRALDGGVAERIRRRHADDVRPGVVVVVLRRRLVGLVEGAAVAEVPAERRELGSGARARGCREADVARLLRRHRESAERDLVGQPLPGGGGHLLPRREARARVDSLEPEAHRQRAVAELLPFLQGRLGRAPERDRVLAALDVRVLGHEELRHRVAGLVGVVIGHGRRDLDRALVARAVAARAEVDAELLHRPAAVRRRARCRTGVRTAGDVLQAEVAVVEPRPAEARRRVRRVAVALLGEVLAHRPEAAAAVQPLRQCVLVAGGEPARVEAVVVPGEDQDGLVAEQVEERREALRERIDVLVADAERGEQAGVHRRVVGEARVRAVVVDEQDVGRGIRRQHAQPDRDVQPPAGAALSSTTSPSYEPGTAAALASTCTGMSAFPFAATEIELTPGTMSKLAIVPASPVFAADTAQLPPAPLTSVAWTVKSTPWPADSSPALRLGWSSVSPGAPAFVRSIRPAPRSSTPARRIWPESSQTSSVAVDISADLICAGVQPG